MKPEEIEKKISDYINSKEDTKVDDELGNLLNTRIWTEIKNKTIPHLKIRTFWWAAASIIGIIMLISLYMVKQKNNQIALLQSELTKQNIEKNTILSQINQLQSKLELSQSNTPNIDTIYKTQIIYKRLNVKDNTITTSDPITINNDSIEKHFEKQAQNTADLIKINKESALSDSLKIKELNNLEMVLANRIQSPDSTTEIIHFKIDLGK